MNQAFMDYTATGKYTITTYKTPVGDFAEKIHFEPASEIDRDIALENLKWRIQNTNTGLSYKLLTLAERDPKSAKPYEILASVMLNVDHDQRQAEEYYRKAVERGSTNAYIYLQLALAELSETRPDDSLDYRLPEKICDSLRGNLDRAIELRTNYLEASNALFLVETFAVKPRASMIDQSESILPLMRPQAKADALVCISVIAWRQGEIENCRSIMALVEKLGPGPIAQSLLKLLKNELDPPANIKPMFLPPGELLRRIIPL